MTYASLFLAAAHASLALEHGQIGDTYIWVLLAVSVVTAKRRGKHAVAPGGLRGEAVANLVGQDRSSRCFPPFTGGERALSLATCG